MYRYKEINIERDADISLNPHKQLNEIVTIITSFAQIRKLNVREIKQFV